MSGLRMISYHYFLVRPKYHNFVLKDARVDRIAVWIKFTGFSIEYFNENFFKKKLDFNENFFKNKLDLSLVRF